MSQDSEGIESNTQVNEENNSNAFQGPGVEGGEVEVEVEGGGVANVESGGVGGVGGSIMDPEEYSLYRWHLNGKKRLKKSASSSAADTFRKYFRCSQAYHPSKEEGCRAAYWQDFSGDIGSPIHMTHSDHNHPPPKSPRVSKETWARLKSLVASGAKPSEIQRLLGKGSFDSNIPSRKQIENMTSRMKRSIFPSGSSQRYMIENYGQSLQLMELHPQINIICMTEEAKECLVDIQTLILDSNFEIFDQNLFLTTFIAKFGERSLPFAWYITSSRTESNYARMFAYIHELTLGKMQAPIVVCSLEPMVRSVIQQTFNSAPVEIIASFSSFLKENLKRLEYAYPSTVISDDTKASLEQSLREIYESEDEKNLQDNISTFEANWASHFPDFVNSFIETWTKLNSPETWANLQRIPNSSLVTSPNHILETWQLRSQRILSELRNVENIVDKLVKALNDEWNSCYQQFVANSQ